MQNLSCLPSCLSVMYELDDCVCGKWLVLQLKYSCNNYMNKIEHTVCFSLQCIVFISELNK